MQVKKWIRALVGGFFLVLGTILEPIEWLRTKNILNNAKEEAHRIAYDPTHRYVILSDLHKGDGRGNDDFQHNESIYRAALHYYDAHDYRFILNGDIEEGFEAKFHDIVKRYEKTALAGERRFFDKGEGYYARTFGNHDYDLRDNPEKYLGSVLPGIKVSEAILLGDDIFIVHGYQGQWVDDPSLFSVGRWVVYVWGSLQRLFGFGQPRASLNPRIAKLRDKLLQRWAKQKRLLLIAGHTHRPMIPTQSEYKFKVPCYINSGAGVHPDGIDAIEINQGTLQLVKWKSTEPNVTLAPDAASPNTIHYQEDRHISRHEVEDSIQLDDLIGKIKST